MKKRTALFFLAIGCVESMMAEVKTTLLSPDGKLRVEIQADKDLTYSVYSDQQLLLSQSHAALMLEGAKASRFTKVKKGQTVKEHIVAPFYKTASYDEQYNLLTLVNANGVNAEFRAYNEGVAYRWVTAGLKGEWKVEQEVAEFCFPADYTAWLSYSTNEKKPKAMAFQNTFDVAPLSQGKDLEAFLPATVDCGSAKVTILESDLENYPGIFVKSVPAKGEGKFALKAEFAGVPTAFDYYPWRQQKYVTQEADYLAVCQGNRTFPWRVMAVTHNDTEMPANHLVYSLASPSRVSDATEWVKPGKVAWDWWNNWGISHVGFKAGINQATYKHYINFAAEKGLEYIILDEGWYNPKSGDMLTVVPEIDLPELVKYAEGKGVGVILWTVFNVLDQQLDEACRRYAAMGVKGFKVDFMDRSDQEALQMAYRIAQRCADFHLMLDYHGIYTPTGMNRTYPNVINFESVFGMEEVKWTERDKDGPVKDMPLYDVTFPFIRMMAGYVDFTPGGMRNATRADFQPIYNNPMTMGTRCHQLAHYIVHDSPLTMLADNPTIYRSESECTDFLASLPTVFEEMRCLQGKIGEYIVMARRQGSDWYVAGETNWDARDITLPLDFLPAGKYSVEIFRDEENSDMVATDYRKVTSISESSPGACRIYNFHLAPGGGFAMKIIKL